MRAQIIVRAVLRLISSIEIFKKASLWPELLEIVRMKVKPIRDNQKRDSNRERWWQYAEKRPGLYSEIKNCNRVLVLSRVRATGFAFLPAKTIFSEQLVVFPLEKYSAFVILQSRIHECWAHLPFGGSALDLIRYSPTYIALRRFLFRVLGKIILYIGVGQRSPITTIALT